MAIQVYDIQGANVATLTDKEYLAGSYSISWDATSNPSGIYFVKIVAGNNLNIQKIMYVK